MPEAPNSTMSGVITAMVTPFDEDGAVDLEAARSLASHLIDNGSHGVVVAGTTGESPTLSDEERVALLAAVLDEIGDRATVIAGIGTNDTRHSVALTRAACRLEPDAVLAVTPYYNKPNRAGLRAHFRAVAEAAGETPLALYNIPSRCVINLDPGFIAELAAEIENVVAVKQANNDEIGRIPGVDVLAGNDDVFQRALALGATGGILVASHVVGPELRAVYDAQVSGDSERARELDVELRPIYEMLTITSNPIPVKAALDMLGVAPANVRLPMVAASPEERATIRAALERRGLLVAGGSA